ncbi:MAG: hypothetical protein A2086_09070 [Spirochaetes bacterium GWD1_27_9]|nr:MAG: hypothetical protein A2Z98_00880 [Spirochaetes bacterium GWB1_27_13]OHD23933.1 MAG: hypothetical protein A2Y34_17245 [Spirochaetes bacterium GWC1_27_15]OHD29163.1 MAG: hypothetical protein A2086_09070 [Spirochaetes bacterium GWD1_27_9]
MISNKKREQYIIVVSYITLFTNAALAISKIVIGSLGGSFAVVSDGIDSSTDVIISIIALITTYIAKKPPDKIHTFGHKRAETIGTKILSFIILFAGIQLCITAVGKIISGQSSQIPNIATVVVILISIFGKITLSVINFNVGKKIKSDLIIANAKNMRNDIITSLSVFIGLGCTIFFKLTILDPIIAILVSIWILKTGFEIFFETSSELMDGIKDNEIYKSIFDVIKQFKSVKNPHKVRVRKLGNFFAVDLDIEVDPNITVKKAHEIVTQIESEIKSKIENIYDIMIHTEPYDNIQHDELYGINEKNLD